MNSVLEIERLSFAADAYPESLFRLYAADPRSLFLVATTGAMKMARIIGYIVIRADRWGAEIVSLAVHPGHRNRGVGRRLLRSAIDRMVRRDARSVRLMVHVNNTAAAKFYRQQGFRPVARVPDYYEDGGAGIRMRLPISSPRKVRP